jgi:hypothetical protein
VAHVEVADAATASIITLLRADSTLRSLLTGSVTPRWSVYDEVPANKSYPYVQIGGDTTETPEDTFGRQGTIALITLHVWSEYAGDKQARDIIARITTLLDRVSLTVGSYATVYCVREFATVMRDPNGIHRHGVVRFRVYASEA